jgi:chromosome segregation ATPase
MSSFESLKAERREDLQRKRQYVKALAERREQTRAYLEDLYRRREQEKQRRDAIAESEFSKLTAEVAGLRKRRDEMRAALAVKQEAAEGELRRLATRARDLRSELARTRECVKEKVKRADSLDEQERQHRLEQERLVHEARKFERKLRKCDEVNCQLQAKLRERAKEAFPGLFSDDEDDL